MAKRTLPPGKVYTLLEPGPGVLLGTAWRGERNLMAMSWHSMLDFEPPLLGCVVSQGNHSFSLLRKARECVINIPTAELAAQVVGCGNTTGAKVDKFARFGLTPKPARTVAVPLVDECFANLECRVVDTRGVNKYNWFVLEVTHAWVDPKVKAPDTLHHRGFGRFMVAGAEKTLPSRMK